MLSSATLSHAEFTGTVPVLIYLSKDDHASPQPPPPITLQVPRSSLLLAVDPFIRSELLSPDFGEAKSEYLKLTHRSSVLAAASSVLPTSPLSIQSVAPLSPGGFGSSNIGADKYLPWQNPIGTCVDVLSSHATDSFLAQVIKKKKPVGATSGSSTASIIGISPGLQAAGAELLAALREEFATINNNKQPSSFATTSPTEKRRRIMLIASMLDEACTSYHSINKDLRVSEGIFPLKLTVSVDNTLPKVHNILWLPGTRSASAASAGTSFSQVALVPAPSSQVLMFLTQLLKQSSQSLFGTIQRVLNSPPGDVEVLRRIPLVARTSNLANASSESQAIQLLQHQQQQQRKLNMSSGAGGTILFFSPQQQQQLMTPQQIASRPTTVGATDVCDAVNNGKFADFAGAMKWLCEQRERMEGVGGVCEGIPVVIHWVTDGQTPSSTSTSITIPNPVRGSPFSVAVASSEGQSFTLQQAIQYALAQLVCKNYGFGSWLDGDKRKAAAKVATKISRTTEDDNAAAVAAGCRSALPQPIDAKFIRLASKAPGSALSPVASPKLKPQSGDEPSSPIRTPTGGSSAGGLSSSNPAGIEWLHAYLLNSYKLTKVTTGNYCDDDELLGRRVEALRRAVQYHADLYQSACGPSTTDFLQRAKAMERVGLSYVAATPAAAVDNGSLTAVETTDTSVSNNSSLALPPSTANEVDSLAASSKDSESAILLRALLLVESMALQRWRDAALEAFEAASGIDSVPSLPNLPLLFSTLLGDESQQPSPAGASATSLPHIHAFLPRVLINGIEISPSTPFLWVYNNMGGGDLRLHITIVMPEGSRPKELARDERK